MDLPEEIQLELDSINRRIEIRLGEFRERFGGVHPPGYDQEYIADLVSIRKGLLLPYTGSSKERLSIDKRGMSPPLKQRQKEAIEKAIRQLDNYS